MWIEIEMQRAIQIPALEALLAAIPKPPKQPKVIVIA